MNCPFCGKEMELGCLQSRDFLGWNRKKVPTIAMGMVMSEQELGHAVTAYRCTICKKMIIDYEKQ